MTASAFTIAEIQSALYIVTACMGALAIFVKIIVRQEGKKADEHNEAQFKVVRDLITAKFDLTTATLNTQALETAQIKKDIESVAKRLTSLEGLPDKVNQLQLELVEHMSKAATRDELNALASKHEAAVQRIHDRIDGIK